MGSRMRSQIADSLEKGGEMVDAIGSVISKDKQSDRAGKKQAPPEIDTTQMGLTNAQLVDMFQEHLSETMTSVTDQHEEQLMLMGFSDSRDVTLLFKNLSADTMRAKAIIEDDLLENLGKACEQQCENAGGVCRY